MEEDLEETLNLTSALPLRHGILVGDFYKKKQKKNRLMCHPIRS